jgi:hypothetical protein
VNTFNADRFVITSTSPECNVLFWTGRAGVAWLSSNRSDAFVVSQERGATLVAAFNKRFGCERFAVVAA